MADAHQTHDHVVILNRAHKLAAALGRPTRVAIRQDSLGSFIEIMFDPNEAPRSAAPALERSLATELGWRVKTRLGVMVG